MSAQLRNAEDPTLTPDYLGRVHAYWRAANYVSVGQIYLLDNPLLREPLQLKHVKPRLLGHRGTTPGLNFNRYHLVEAVIDFVPGLGEDAAHVRQRVRDKLVEHREYIRRYGEDMPEKSGSGHGSDGR